MKKREEQGHERDGACVLPSATATQLQASSGLFSCGCCLVCVRVSQGGGVS